MPDEIPVGYPSPCYEECWEAKPCPVCDRGMNPRGRSAPLELACLRTDCPEDDSRVNPRHLWGADDEERYRFWNEDGTPSAESLEVWR